MARTVCVSPRPAKKPLPVEFPPDAPYTEWAQQIEADWADLTARFQRVDGLSREQRDAAAEIYSQRLEIVGRHTLFTQLYDDCIQALDAEVELIFTFWTLRVRASERLQRRADAIDRWRDCSHDAVRVKHS